MTCREIQSRSCSTTVTQENVSSEEAGTSVAIPWSPSCICVISSYTLSCGAGSRSEARSRFAVRIITICRVAAPKKRAPCF